MTATTIFEPSPNAETPAPSVASDFLGLVLVLLIIASCFALLQTHLLLHTGHGIVAVSRDPAIYLREFDYVGGVANGYTVTLEIAIWSLMGLQCRMAYIIGRAALNGEINFIRMLTMWLSSTVFGWGTTTVLVWLLYLIKLDIGAVAMGLSRIEAIVSLSFVLGFYNDETRRVLGVIRAFFRRTAA